MPVTPRGGEAALFCSSSVLPLLPMGQDCHDELVFGAVGGDGDEPWLAQGLRQICFPLLLWPPRDCSGAELSRTPEVPVVLVSCWLTLLCERPFHCSCLHPMLLLPALSWVPQNLQAAALLRGLGYLRTYSPWAGRDKSCQL